MKISISMLRSIADSAQQMAAAMQAVVADCEEQLVQRKAAGESEAAIWAEPFDYLGKQPAAHQDGSQAAQTAPRTEEKNDCTPEEPSQPAGPPLTIVELRAFVAEKSTVENRPTIKEILSQHGVKKLTELREDQYRSVMEAVRKVCK